MVVQIKLLQYAYNKKFDYLFESGDHQGFISDLVNIFKKRSTK